MQVGLSLVGLLALGIVHCMYCSSSVFASSACSRGLSPHFSARGQSNPKFLNHSIEQSTKNCYDWLHYRRKAIFKLSSPGRPGLCLCFLVHETKKSKRASHRF